MAAKSAWYTKAVLAKAKRTRARAARSERLRQKNIELVVSGEADKLRERGIDIFARPPYVGVDGGAGQVLQADMPPDPMRVSDYIRAVVNDPERAEERNRLKRGGSIDAKDIPEDTPLATSYPAVPWEDEVSAVMAPGGKSIRG